MNRSPNNFRRQKLLDCGFMQKVELLNVSDRNIQIVTEYANGSSFNDLADKYKLTDGRIGAIVAMCIRKCNQITLSFK